MKKGDTVECIKAKGFPTEGNEFIKKDRIVVGKTYIISSVQDYSGKSNNGLNLIGCFYTHPISSFKKVIKEKTMALEKEIKEYKVITTFPTATKDWQVGEIVKKGTALYKKAHKFPAFFEPVKDTVIDYKVGDIIYYHYDKADQPGGQIGEILKMPKDGVVETTFSTNLVHTKELLTNAHPNSFRKATSKEIEEYRSFKEGECVVVVKKDDSAPSTAKLVGKTIKIIAQDKSWPKLVNLGVKISGFPEIGNSDGGYLVNPSVLRKASASEIRAFATQKPATKQVVVSNNKITLTVHKDGRITSGSQAAFKIDAVKSLLAKLTAIEGHIVGPWGAHIASSSAYIIRIGCKDENFCVSQADLAAVISAYNSVQ